MLQRLLYKGKIPKRMGVGIMITIDQGARIIVESWLKAQPDDVLHFITDETKLSEAAAFMRAAEGCGAVPKVSVIPEDSVQCGETIEDMKHIMSYANAIVGATNYSFITTDAVTYALKHGARFLSLPLSTNDGSSLLEQDFMKMNPRTAAKIASPYLSALKKADTVHVTTELGTDLTMHIEGRNPGLFNGVAARRGVCASASFEVYVAPVETKTNGTMVVDGSMGYIGLVSEPLKLTIKDGYITDIPDTPSGKRLKEFIDSFNDHEMLCAAEFGIGLNEISKCRGSSYIEDESAYGTFHIGFGRNLALGGVHSAPGHFDLVTHDPDVWADNVQIIRKGVSL